jgi:hypothetical protein
MRIVTKGTEIFATGLAKACQRPCAATRTEATAFFCQPQAAASSKMPRRLFTKLAPLALLALLLGGCSREEPQTPPEESVIKRMEDPAYNAQLKSLRAEQSELADRANSVAKELEAARAADPASERTKELEKRHAAVLAEMEALRAKTLVTIRNRMLQDEADAKGDGKKGNR